MSYMDPMGHHIHEMYPREVYEERSLAANLPFQINTHLSNPTRPKPTSLEIKISRRIFGVELNG